MESVVATVSGYHGSERFKLISQAGGSYVGALNQSTAHLICRKFEGRKYELAIKFRTVIVNHQWIEDCIKQGRRVPEHSYASSCGKEMGPLQMDIPVVANQVSRSSAGNDSKKHVIDIDCEKNYHFVWTDSSLLKEVPKVEKIVVNCSIKDAAQNSKHLDAAVHYLTLITGQRPGKKQAKNAIASFKNRENQPLGIAVTLRGNVMYSFLERLITSGLHSTSEFQGVRPNSFDQDGNGNYRIGIREQILFPEISYDVLGEPRRIDVRISTTAQTDKEAHILLALMGMPFSEGAAPTNVAQEVEASPF